MKCRHCSVAFHDTWTVGFSAYDKFDSFTVSHTTCPTCGRLNVAYGTKPGSRIFLYPRAISREPIDPCVPAEFADDYIQACNVLDISPKASAALSRRCLQHILRDCAKVTAPNLDQEIQQVIKGNMVPSYIADSLDAVRNIGNFATHPMKSTASGQILDVEPGEAEWNLDTVEQLFDFYFVGPAKKAAQKTALNEKLAEAGKPPLK
jgi:hypothetical protein